MGPHFSELSHSAQVSLAGWLVLALTSGEGGERFAPGPDEDLPMGYGQALGELSPLNRRRRLRSRHLRTQTVRPNKARQIRVTKVVGALA